MKQGFTSSFAAARRGVLASIIGAMAMAAWSGGGTTKQTNAADVAPVDVSADYILAANGDGKGLEIISARDGSTTIISNQNTASNGASISPDGTRVGYKSFDAQGNQQPTIYNIADGNYQTMATAPLAGTPVISADGHIAYTVGNQLYVLAPGNSELPVHFDLGSYVNSLTISNNGKLVAFSNDKDQITVLNLKSGQQKTLTHDAAIYYSPSFSPNGKLLMARTLTGDVVTVAVKSGKAHNLGHGNSPGWLDNNSIALTQKSVIEGIGVESSSLVELSTSGKVKSVIASAKGDAEAAVDGGNFAFAERSDPGAAQTIASVKVKHGFVNKGQAFSVDVNTASKVSASQAIGAIAPRDVVNGSTTVELSNVPYIHQAYDTPDWWDGDWSCNATAALMALQYYNILPKHPMTVSTPTSHNSDYGWYIPNNYSFNGHTFNVGSLDPLGTTGYGGYGYITQNGWEDTKGHMAEYLADHGPTSSVDWSPTFAEATAEVDANHPFVVLTDLTSSGHYPLCIGYVKSQHTLIFNDPWGNKNISYPSPDGRGARYDWPGYNNGYQNLNTVYCFIWCRFTPPAAPSSLTATASGTTINLAWHDNSSCEANYDVLRSTTTGGPYTLVTSLGSNVTSYGNSGLSGGTTYYYVVRARNASGSSANSNQANATTGGAATTITIDNTSANFSASSSWATGSSSSDKYGSDYRFRSTQAISDNAVWTFNITVAGNYSIQACWPQGSNRSGTAPFILPDSTTVHVNEQINGGSWQALGTQYLAVGSQTVRLSCWTTTGYVVVADAVRVVPQ